MNIDDYNLDIEYNKSNSNYLNYIKKNHELFVDELAEKEKLIKDLQETVDVRINKYNICRNI